MNQADTWEQATAALPAVIPELDTYASAERLSVSLDTETTRLLLGEVPAAFHAGIHDILLIAYALAWTEFLGADHTQSASTSRATAATTTWPTMWTCRAPWAGSPPNTR